MQDWSVFTPTDVSRWSVETVVTADILISLTMTDTKDDADVDDDINVADCISSDSDDDFEPIYTNRQR